MSPSDVLHYWFTELPADKRFAKDDALDAAIRARFGALLDQLSRSVPEAWLGDARSILAAIIVLDQFSRNLRRDSAAAFANDAQALTLSNLLRAQGLDRALGAEEKQFAWMPLMHSEALADQERSVALFETLGDEDALKFARLHRDIVARFGRFPHRNAVLGRASTAAEEAFLGEPNSSF